MHGGATQFSFLLSALLLLLLLYYYDYYIRTDMPG